jgi:hypothetical protein
MKKRISLWEKGIQFQISTLFVNNFVVHYVKINYFSDAFERCIIFEQKPLKFNIEFTRNFVKKIFLKTIQVDLKLKSKSKTSDTQSQLTMCFCELLNISVFSWIFYIFGFHYGKKRENRNFKICS